MRSFSCTYYHLLKNNILFKNSNIVCWKGIYHFHIDFDHKDIKELIPKDFVINKRLSHYINTPLSNDLTNTYIQYLSLNTISDEPEYIYIDEFRDTKTEKYIEVLINLINDITECKLVKIDNKEYIKFKFLHSYDSTLILLNFIRNLWYEPVKGYTELFFDSLLRCEYKDSLEKLTYANREACKLATNYSAGHSNVQVQSSLKVKSTKDLLKYQGTSTQTFLTT